MRKAVLFDLFDTLITRRSKDGTSLAGVPTEIAATFAEVWQSWGERRMTSPVLYESLLRAAFESASVVPGAGRVEELAAERAAAKERQLVEVDADVLSVVRECHSRGLKLAVVSGCAVDDVAAWEKSPLASHIEVTAFSFVVGANKPQPAIYMAALDALKVAPVEAVFVDDMGSCLQGARAVGIEKTVRAAWFIDRAGSPALPDSPVAHAPRELLVHL